ncbi:MAG: hypothetical protein J6I84_02550 [Bacilli bacterium]|nr:hypothetical protein [Bacilli bacterium]
MRIPRLSEVSDFSDLLDFDFFDRSERMKELHREGRYIGTSKIGVWNRSEEKRERMKRIREQNQKDKTSRGYGSEYHQRQANRTLLHNKFQGLKGFMYLLEFPKTIKVGFSKNWERRTSKQIIGGRVVLIISGPTNNLADLEFDTLVEFQDFTQLDETGTRYTEFLDKKVAPEVYDFLMEHAVSDPTLKVEVQNPL